MNDKEILKFSYQADPDEVVEIQFTINGPITGAGYREYCMRAASAFGYSDKTIEEAFFENI